MIFGLSHPAIAGSNHKAVLSTFKRYTTLRSVQLIQERPPQFPLSCLRLRGGYLRKQEPFPVLSGPPFGPEVNYDPSRPGQVRYVQHEPIGAVEHPFAMTLLHIERA